MKLLCPSCQSTNIKKSGHTYYGKQNHRCKCCGRQLVLNNHHTIKQDAKELMKHCLKERLSLRAICRIFDVSLTWLQSFARLLWSQTPDNLGLGEEMINRVKRLQVFGIHADEMWSFVKQKVEKRWIWITYDSVHRLVVAYHIGKRDKEAAMKFWNKIPEALRDCNFETDDWQTYESIIPSDQYKVGKDLTYYIENWRCIISVFWQLGQSNFITFIVWALQSYSFCPCCLN